MTPRNLFHPTMLPALAAAMLLAVTSGAAADATATDAPQSTAATIQTEPIAAPGDDSTPLTSLGQAPTAPPALSPLHQEIRALLDQQRAEIEALSAQIAQETDAARALELQRSVEAAKRKLQVDVLEVQLRHARAAGKTEAIVAIEAALQQQLHPEVTAKPQPRPVANAPDAH